MMCHCDNKIIKKAAGVFSLTFLVYIVIILALQYNDIGPSYIHANKSYSAQKTHSIFTTALRVFTKSAAPTKSEPHAILFTTFKSTKERFWIQSKVILNWRELMPSVQPVLFANQVDNLTNLAVKHGWKVLPMQRTNIYGTPHLIPMFDYVLRCFNATFYIFSNGDILYNDEFLKTLFKIKSSLHKLKNVLATGRRWNYFFDKYNRTQQWDIWKPEKVGHLKKLSEKFRIDAEDYFIVTRDFPWKYLTDIVIGRPGYDNYLVAMANSLNVNTIDATNTITALHLSPNGSVFQGKSWYYYLSIFFTNTTKINYICGRFKFKSPNF